MKTLIAEDNSTSPLLLQELLNSHGQVRISVNGREAVAAVRLALKTAESYELICLDIMLPKMDGQEALKETRRIESAASVAGSNCTRIVMTSTLAVPEEVRGAIRRKCDCFLARPIQKANLLEELHKLALIS